MKTLGILGWITALIVTIIAFVHDGCNGTPKEEETKTEVTFQYDTVKYHAVVATGQPTTDTIILPGKVIHDTLFIPAPIDSMKVVIDYFTSRYYQRQFADSNIAITFHDSVYKNMLVYSTFDYRLLRPTAIITNTVTKQVEARNRLYVGLGLAMGSTGVFPAAGPELLWVGKDKMSYRIGYHFGQNQSNLSTAIYWRIGK